MPIIAVVIVLLLVLLIVGIVALVVCSMRRHKRTKGEVLGKVELYTCVLFASIQVYPTLLYIRIMPLTYLSHMIMNCFGHAQTLPIYLAWGVYMYQQLPSPGVSDLSALCFLENGIQGHHKCYGCYAVNFSVHSRK